VAAYALLTKLSPEALTKPESVVELNAHVAKRINAKCPSVKWVSNDSVLGPYDDLDIFEAPDVKTATQIALIVCSFGHATTETWNTTP